MKVTTAIKQFQKNYEIAMKRDGIRKPISWALHKTWMWADVYEKERKDGKRNKIFKELEIEQTEKRWRVHGTREKSKEIFSKR